ENRYATTHKSQLLPILKEVGPLNEMDQPVVQFPNYTVRKDMTEKDLPPPEAPFFRYVKDWDTRDKDISEEFWIEQENLAITRELCRRVKMANDSVANFEPVSEKGRDNKMHPVPGRFVNPYWQIDVLGVKGDQIKLKLTNRLDRPQAVNVNFRVQFQKGGPFVAIAPVKDNDPLPPAGTKEGKDSLVRDLKIEGEAGAQGVGGRQVLTWETAAGRR